MEPEGKSGDLYVIFHRVNREDKCEGWTRPDARRQQQPGREPWYRRGSTSPRPRTQSRAFSPPRNRPERTAIDARHAGW
eukprot:3938006-Rhodomonas_salina.1